MRRVFLHCNRILGTVLGKWRNPVAMYSCAKVAPFEISGCMARQACIDAESAVCKGFAPCARPTARHPPECTDMVRYGIFDHPPGRDLKRERLPFAIQITPPNSQKLCDQPHPEWLRTSIWHLFLRIRNKKRAAKARFSVSCCRRSHTRDRTPQVRWVSRARGAAETRCSLRCHRAPGHCARPSRAGARSRPARALQAPTRRRSRRSASFR
jgi:hypothetical protein